MSSEFDYTKYIWLIQLRRKSMFFLSLPPSAYVQTADVDYVNRRIILRETDKHEQVTKEQIFVIDDEESFAELLTYSEITKIREFESLDETELALFDRGYRDGWYMEYSYFTKDDPPRTDGRVTGIYKNNPIEKIAGWICRNVPEDEDCWFYVGTMI